LHTGNYIETMVSYKTSAIFNAASLGVMRHPDCPVCNLVVTLMVESP